MVMDAMDAVYCCSCCGSYGRTEEVLSAEKSHARCCFMSRRVRVQGDMMDALGM